MVSKTLSFSCSECGIDYSITSVNWESIQYCPFCGDGGLTPYDGEDDEGSFEDDEFSEDD